MKISLDWMKELASWDDEPEVLASKLTAAGLNVEAIEHFEQTYPGVVIAKVVHRQQHPNADRLSLCRVDAGTGQEVQVVCGAPNVREGLTVLFAQVGAILPGDFKLKKTKIRGIESLGMICSASELQLTSDSEGIMELDTDLPPGTPADELYGFKDVVLDIEVTPNRPDWLNHLGVAREIAALYGTKVSQPRCWSSQQSTESLGLKIQVEDFEDCPRYTAFVAKGVEIGQSPLWMQNRLRAVGSRPINNVVDITNYVMLEMGQPMHAFDQDRLSGDTIFIRRSEAGQKIVTLDDKEHELDGENLLVCDQDGPIALAGVMGLANSEVTEATSNIVLESAFFAPRLVRKTSRALGLISESSYRFERGTDWGMVEKAAHRALYLMQEYTGARIISDWADRGDPDRKSNEPVPLRTWQVNRVLGTELSTEDVAQFLQNLGLKVQPMGNPDAINASAVNMMVEIPTFRRDIFLEIDLIEEVARCHGFERLAAGKGFKRPAGHIRRRTDEVQSRVRTWFADCGYNELVTSTFLSPGDLEKLELPEGDVRLQTLSVINPHHGGNTQLRTSLLPSMLEVARRNLNAGSIVPVRFFQFNRTFWPGGKAATDTKHDAEKLLPQEPFFLQFAIAGLDSLGLDGVPDDLLEIKGVLNSLSEILRVDLKPEAGNSELFLASGQQWRILDRQGKVVGSAGRVSSPVLKNFDLDVPVTVAEINLDEIDLTPQNVEYQPFARFPGVTRDLSLLVPSSVTYQEIEEVVREGGGVLLVGVELFDVYRGKGIPEGVGAYGIRLKFRSDKGNLKGKAVDKAISRILKDLTDRLQIEPRSLD
ncbi:MAG: phenylalanine--tRNA ligase subunit beta [Gemmatimonadales bacterium]|nr:phenylalanine--tRNA ligase subunit beta [Gemmatimonadales bacterium]